MNNRLNNVKESRQNLQNQLESIRKNIEAERAARPETVSFVWSTFDCWYDSSIKAERTAELTELAAAKEKLNEVEKELSQYGSCDPVKIEAKRRAVTLANEAALRWTGWFSLVTNYSIASLMVLLIHRQCRFGNVILFPPTRGRYRRHTQISWHKWWLWRLGLISFLSVITAMGYHFLEPGSSLGCSHAPGTFGEEIIKMGKVTEPDLLWYILCCFKAFRADVYWGNLPREYQCTWCIQKCRFDSIQ